VRLVAAGQVQAWEVHEGCVVASTMDSLKPSF
jgi:hypothetical protein